MEVELNSAKEQISNLELEKEEVNTKIKDLEDTLQ
jgi:predicted  nucleic acid-binding Zn-ribbon protein